MTLDLSRHPCFNDAVRHEFGRIHLPVAPKCNVKCNFCDRKHDCANESRPGVTSAVLSPEQAMRYLHKALAKSPEIAVVGIAGPGDPFANPNETLRTLELVREEYPEMLLCVASNGLEVAPHAARLAELQVSHVTLTVNAVDPEISSRIYAWVRKDKRAYRGTEAADLLLASQLETLRQLKRHGVTVKTNSIIIPGINDKHIPEVARTVAELGANLCNCVPFYPVDNTAFGTLDPPTDQEVAEIRREAGKHLPLMHHCTRCRADAVGLLGEPMSDETLGHLKWAANLSLRPTERRPYVAVASHEGVLVNQHLGEASRLHVFGEACGEFELIESRPTPTRGGGVDRWKDLARSLRDCRALLVAGAGNAPRTVLTDEGIHVVMMEGLVEDGLNAVYHGKKIHAPLRSEHQCGSGCAGNGMGCM